MNNEIIYFLPLTITNSSIISLNKILVILFDFLICLVIRLYFVKQFLSTKIISKIIKI